MVSLFSLSPLAFCGCGGCDGYQCHGYISLLRNKYTDISFFLESRIQDP